jgi:hypothetical protein
MNRNRARPFYTGFRTPPIKEQQQIIREQAAALNDVSRRLSAVEAR